MKKLFLTLSIGLFLTKSFAQSSEIKPNQGISVPQFETAFIDAMTTQPKGTVVFDKDLNVMKYWDGTIWQQMSGGGGGGYEWTTNGIDILNTNAGNVGVGTGTPKVKFDIATPYTTNAIFGSTGVGVSIQQNWPTIGFNQYRDASNVQRYIGTGYAFSNFMDPNSGNFYWHTIGTGTADSPTPAETQLMVLEKYGNLKVPSISALNSSYPLGVGGSALTAVSTGGSLAISHSESLGLFFTNRAIEIDGTRIQAKSGFLSYSAARLLLNPYGGNVGIGTGSATLSYKLEVNGTARSKEVIVESGWADYVFEEDYKLKSIDELEAFVKENKHLPNIPKASEIEANGLKVGETNKAMMEKIEELALYIIQLKKEIDVLKSKK